MAVKRKIEDSENPLDTRSGRFERSGKKKRVDAVMDVSEVGVAPSETGKYHISTRSKSVETKKTVKVEAEDMSEDDGSRMNSPEREDFEAERLKYEEERNRILEENRKRMRELGLPDLTKHLSSTYRTQAHLRSAAKAIEKINRMKHQVEAGFQPRRSARYASRPEGSPIPTYKDFFKVKEEERKEHVPRRRISYPPRTTKEEMYTEQHLKLLGSCKNEWKLFRDGCYPDGGRVYDSENGKTCHQCRQKTLGYRTWCRVCQSRSGQFCGDCLFMRYGENVLEAKANGNWVCPVCRGICNCSFCRLKRGWTPTGNMYRQVLSQGFPSVAHYLVTTYQGSPARENEKVDVTAKPHHEDNNDFILQPETPSPTQKISPSATKIEAPEIGDATPAEVHHNKARLEKDVRRFESESFVVKVEINHAKNGEEIGGGSTANLCKEIKQEEYKGSNQDASQLQNGHEERKEVEARCNVRSGGNRIGDIPIANVIPKREERFFASEDVAVPPGARGIRDTQVTEFLTKRKERFAAPKDGVLSAGPGNKSSVKEESPICLTPVCTVSKACHVEAVTVQGNETAVEHDTPAKIPAGAAKAEILPQRQALKGSQLASLETLPCRTESICRRLRRKETINYKRFL